MTKLQIHPHRAGTSSLLLLYVQGLPPDNHLYFSRRDNHLSGGVSATERLASNQRIYLKNHFSWARSQRAGSAA